MEASPSSKAPTTTTTTTTTTIPPDPHPSRPKKLSRIEEDSAKTLYRASEGISGNEATFFVITNDNSERNLVWLICLKEIFAKQLPKMPREYIVRLLFDKNHISLLCVEGGEVVGGISFRPFYEQKFGEIAFCAVSASHQVKGFGTRLMNHLKEYVKTINLTHFLTYADNFAIGYFKKQGFSDAISMPKERWTGYIKDYDGGTLMECVVNPKINYLAVPELIRRQREFLLSKITEAKSLDPVYPGLEKLLSGEKITDPYSQIPGLKEGGWRKPLLSAAQTQGPGAGRAMLSGVAGAELQSVMRGIFDQVYASRDAWPFFEPVPASVHDYVTVIKHPVDLSLIRQRIDCGLYYATAGHLRRDLQLMVDNCMTYNQPDTTFFKAAGGLEKMFPDIFGDVAIQHSTSSSMSNGTAAAATAATSSHE